jgi:hypothetical protein
MCVTGAIISNYAIHTVIVVQHNDAQHNDIGHNDAENTGLFETLSIIQSTRH